MSETEHVEELQEVQLASIQESLVRLGIMAEDIGTELKTQQPIIEEELPAQLEEGRTGLDAANRKIERQLGGWDRGKCALLSLLVVAVVITLLLLIFLN
jgi:hypothetical protein